jgi:hypothetical protein
MLFAVAQKENTENVFLPLSIGARVAIESPQRCHRVLLVFLVNPLGGAFH